MTIGSLTVDRTWPELTYLRIEVIEPNPPQFIRVFPGENTLQFIFKKLLLYFGIFEVLNFLRTQLMRSQGALDAGTIRIPYNYINSIERHFYFVQRGIIEGSSCASCSKKS